MTLYLLRSRERRPIGKSTTLTAPTHGIALQLDQLATALAPASRPEAESPLPAPSTRITAAVTSMPEAASHPQDAATALSSLLSTLSPEDTVAATQQPLASSTSRDVDKAVPRVKEKPKGRRAPLLLKPTRKEFESDSSSCNEGDDHWSVKLPQRARSLSPVVSKNSSRTMGQVPTVDLAIEAAKRCLTPEQHVQLNRCEAAVTKQPDDPSRQKGHPQNKGKGPDPKNWGGLDIDSDELDPNRQRKRFEQLKTQRTKAERS